MSVCNFCHEEIEKGTGVIYSKKDGTIFNFCSSKCKKNQLKLKREGRKKRWTKSYVEFKKQTERKKKK